MYGTSGVIEMPPPPASRRASPAIQRGGARGLVVYGAQGGPAGVGPGGRPPGFGPHLKIALCEDKHGVCPGRRPPFFLRPK